jgi:DNA-binding NarL/FixJ family response regulator
MPRRNESELVPTSFDTGSVVRSTPLSTSELRARYRLTDREVQVARRLAAGRTNAQIAGELAISLHTVRRHVEHVLLRLDVSRRSEVAARLIEVHRETGK